MNAYMGYVGSIEYSRDDGCFHGRVLGIGDVVNFEAETIGDLEEAFKESVDDYLEFCAEKGIEPQKPKSGKLAVRLAPEVHEMVATAATADAMSVNQWIAGVLKEAAEKRLAERSIKIKVR